MNELPERDDLIVEWLESIGRNEIASVGVCRRAAAIIKEQRSRLEEPFQKRVTDLGYDNLETLVAVHQRNVKWLEAIHYALRKYRVSLVKTEAEAFRDLTHAIEEPPT